MTSVTLSWKCAPEPAVTKRRCLPAICSACTAASAESRRWQVEILSANEGEHGGFKEVIAKFSGDGVYGRLKFESGGHRVQRVPATESQGVFIPPPAPWR